MTNIKNFNYKKVCKVYSLIGQICKIQGLDWLEEILLNQWTKMVLNNQDKDEEVAFILAKYSFLDYFNKKCLPEM